MPLVTLGQADSGKVRLIVWCKACQHRFEPDTAADAELPPRLIPFPPPMARKYSDRQRVKITVRAPGRCVTAELIAAAMFSPPRTDGSIALAKSASLAHTARSSMIGTPRAEASRMMLSLMMHRATAWTRDRSASPG